MIRSKTMMDKYTGIRSESHNVLGKGVRLIFTYIG